MVKIILQQARSFILPAIVDFLQLPYDALMPPGEGGVTILLGLSLPIGRYNYCPVQVEHRDLGIRRGREIRSVQTRLLRTQRFQPLKA
jgi:hypothetical protein